jgi:anthranilate phosphoribosyltransferase
MRDTIKQLSEGRNLTDVECGEAMEKIMSGAATPVQTAAFLTALRLKGETTDEIFGAARLLRSKVRPVTHHQEMTFDNCGTGGDCSGTFNISTTAAIIIAACGVPVAKHGNRSVSSSCGSADVLQQLGVELMLSPEQIGECIDEVGFGFLFAPNLHPAMKAVAPVRKELGFRTIFNLLGPLTNPASATHQLIGVFDGRYVEKIAEAARRLGITKVMVVHNQGGVDEIATTGLNYICAAENGTCKSFQLNPIDYHFQLCNVGDLRGGDAAQSANITLSVLKGETGARRDTVILNAAVSLHLVGRTDSIDTGIEMAADSIDSGLALKKLETFAALTRKLSNA